MIGIRVSLCFLFLVMFLVWGHLRTVDATCMMNAIASDCNENFDCNNNIKSDKGNGGRAYCDAVAPGSCYEVFMNSLDYFTICFAPINQPTPTAAPCGSINYNCCLSPPYCNSGLTPVQIEQGGGMTCLCQGLTPIPTNNPDPTGLPTFMPTNTPAVTAMTGTDPFCVKGNSPKVNTALGCVPIKIEDFVPWILQYLFGIAGGIAFLLMVYGFILVGTSSGDEKKVQGARETITSAITGLLVCVFGLFILNLIGNNILKIPGF